LVAFLKIQNGKKMRILLISFVWLSIGQAFGQRADIVKWNGLSEVLVSKASNITIINFWATWCSPCVKELPLFEKLNAEGREGVSVTLVSLDLDLDPNPEKIFKFIERKKLRSRVLILDEKDPNSWIDKVDSTWSGALPATLIINQKTGRRKFLEKELHEGDLEKIIEELNN
jgi:thiol-disulfide isomerase/thioredoxin